MSTHNICFYGDVTKIILQLSSNTLLICSTHASALHDEHEILYGLFLCSEMLNSSFFRNITSLTMFVQKYQGNTFLKSNGRETPT